VTPSSDIRPARAAPLTPVGGPAEQLDMSLLARAAARIPMSVAVAAFAVAVLPHVERVAY